MFALNGHVADDIEAVQAKVKYAQPPHLFRNLGQKRFQLVTQAGEALQKAVVGRGAAYGDFDNDGDLDLLLTSNNGPARLLRNDGGNANHWLRVHTVGTRSNRDGIGARVTVTTPSGSKLWNVVRTGGSYLSQSDTALTFGLGSQAKAARVEVLWPSGQSDVLTDVLGDRTISVVEGKGPAPEKK